MNNIKIEKNILTIFKNIKILLKDKMRYTILITTRVTVSREESSNKEVQKQEAVTNEKNIHSTVDTVMEIVSRFSFVIQSEEFEVLKTITEDYIKNEIKILAANKKGNKNQKKAQAIREICMDCIQDIEMYISQLNCPRKIEIDFDLRYFITRVVVLNKLQESVDNNETFENLPMRCEILEPNEYRSKIKESEDICENKECDKKSKYSCRECFLTRYCSSECQKTDWKKHKLICKKCDH